MKKTRKLSIACYIVAAVLLAIAVYTAVSNVMYLKSYADTYGIGLSSMWQDAVSYIISGFVPYFANAFIIFVLGKILKDRIETCDSTAADTEEPEATEEAEVTEEAEATEEAAEPEKTEEIQASDADNEAEEEKDPDADRETV